ncbi:MAG TPA: hypothetical protein VHE35_30850, partial [Kofleriaceae bacterium]|nr:hypothetical protein [Kofleriaceae bacterium]
AAAAAAAAMVAVAATGCAHLGFGRAREAPADVRIVLYRDRALVDERIDAVVRGGQVELPRPAGVAAEDLAITSDDVQVRAWAAAAPDGQRDVTAVSGARTAHGRLLGYGDDGVVLLEPDGVHLVGGAELLAGAVRPPIVARVDGREGRATFHLRYPTDRVTWQASYTLVDHGGKGRLRGALTVDNQTGRRWHRVALSVIDAPVPDPQTGGGDLPALVRLPGRYELEPGPQRLELALRDRPLALESTLVYDPVGPGLDRTGSSPERDAMYGVRDWPDNLAETVKIDLGSVADVQLPSGPVRLASVDAGGALRWRGEGELLPPAAGAARYLTVTVGRADDVTGSRKRTDFVVDDLRQRLYEEIAVTVTNKRAVPVDVLVREHLYRGQCWMLAYHSTGDRVDKEGTQRIALGATVPAAGSVTVVYRVVYHWSAAECTP